MVVGSRVSSMRRSEDEPGRRSTPSCSRAMRAEQSLTEDDPRPRLAFGWSRLCLTTRLPPGSAGTSPALSCKTLTIQLSKHGSITHLGPKTVQIMGNWNSLWQRGPHLISEFSAGARGSRELSR